jgi:excisionase family DNA binding protein
LIALLSHGPTTGNCCHRRASSVRTGAPVPEPRAALFVSPLEPLLTVVEVAGLLRLQPSTVRAYSERGSLPHVRIGGRLRFRAADVARWIDQRSSGSCLRPKGQRLAENGLDGGAA